MKRPHLKPVVELLNNTEISLPPKPWKLIGCYAVGNCWAVGFLENTDNLLVVSSQGRGLFDCLTGEEIARDYEYPVNDDIYNPIKLEALGIGNYSTNKVRMSGIDGGGLPTQTYDGWNLEKFTIEFPFDSITLSSSADSWGAYGILNDKPHSFNKIFEDCELRAFGFSPTGKTLIVADSSDMNIYGRG